MGREGKCLIDTRMAGEANRMSPLENLDRVQNKQVGRRALYVYMHCFRMVSADHLATMVVSIFA